MKNEEKTTASVAVYGTLMEGEANAWLIPEGTQRTRAKLTGTLIDTGHGYPAFVPAGETAIEAEIVEVDERTLFRLDILEGVPHLYRRQRVKAELEGGAVATVWGYVYARNAPCGARLIKGGDWRAWRAGKAPGRS